MEDYNGSGNIDTNSLLLARGVGGGYGYGGFGGFGGGYGYGGGILTAEAMANGTATKEAIDCNSQRMTDGLARISAQAEEGRRMANFTAIVDGMNNNTVRISDNLANTALQNAINDGNTRVENVRTLADMRADSAKCCCDTQKLIAEEGCKTRELINARALDDAQRALDQALAKNTAGDTVAALVGAMQNQTATLIAALGHNGHHPHP